MSIHYCHDHNRPGAKTACGYIFDMCSAGECLSDDTESTDCEACLASDEHKAQTMENALYKPDFLNTGIEPGDTIQTLFGTDMYEKS